MYNLCSSHKLIGALKSTLREWGILENMISDNGPKYDSGAFKSFIKTWDFKHVTSSPTYAQSNSFIERFVQTIKITMKKVKDSRRDMNMALLCLRTTPTDHKLPSSVELLYSKAIRIYNMKSEKDKIYKRLRAWQEVQKRYYNQKAWDLQPSMMART